MFQVRRKLRWSLLGTAFLTLFGASFAVHGELSTQPCMTDIIQTNGCATCRRAVLIIGTYQHCTLAPDSGFCDPEQGIVPDYLCQEERVICPGPRFDFGPDDTTCQNPPDMYDDCTRFYKYNKVQGLNVNGILCPVL